MHPDILSRRTDDLARRLSRWFSRNSLQLRAFNDVSNNISMGTWLGHRQDNQDLVVFCRLQSRFSRNNFALLLLCDGIGGLKDGASTARLAASSVISYLVDQDSLRSASLLRSVHSANERIHAEHKGASGCTLSAVLITDEAVAATNIGDSRIYILNDIGITQLSIDDTLAAHIAKQGAPAEEFEPEHNSLVQYVGIGRSLQVNLLEIPVERKDSRFLVASDGAYFVGTSLIKQLSAKARDNKEFVRRLIVLAEWLGGNDNATTIVAPAMIRVSPTEESTSARVLRLWDPYGTIELWFEPKALARDTPAQVRENTEAPATPGRRSRRKPTPQPLPSRNRVEEREGDTADVILTFIPAESIDADQTTAKNEVPSAATAAATFESPATTLNEAVENDVVSSNSE